MIASMSTIPERRVCTSLQHVGRFCVIEMGHDFASAGCNTELKIQEQNDGVQPVVRADSKTGGEHSLEGSMYRLIWPFPHPW